MLAHFNVKPAGELLRRAFAAVRDTFPLLYVRQRVRTIRDDPVLRYYGSALSLVSALTAAFWLYGQPIADLLQSRDSVCWPFLENCFLARPVSPAATMTILFGLWSGGIIAAGLFTSAARVGVAYALLIALNLLRLAVVLMDYRLISNQHYMILWVTAVFLFTPSRRTTLIALLVSFYVAAGLLKLNVDWLSGAALYGNRPLGMPDQWVPLACRYVIVLELVVVFGVLAKSRWLFWAAVGQLVLFHISSFWVVGFFYPLLMFALLSIIVMDRVLPLNRSTADPSHKLLTYVVLAAFGFCQLVPRLMSSDPAITGEGRMWALNMFDAPISCTATVTRHQLSGPVSSQFQVQFVQPRIACDPIVFLEAAKSRCRTEGGRQDFDLRLQSRRASSATTDLVFDLSGVCSAMPHYSVLWRNDWILPK